jgi:predicted nuclease of predicted toxin-antitoxin system
VKFFLDRDLGKKLGRSMRAVGLAVTLHAERYPDADAEPDRAWIKRAAADGEIILTRDGKIRRIDVELTAIVENGGRCITFETGNASPLDYLVALMSAWRRIEELNSAAPPPWVYGLRRDGRLIRRYPARS